MAFACTILILLAALAPSQTPPTFDDLAAKATAAREHNEIADAIATYRRAVRVKPDWPEGWWYLGMLQYNMGIYADARDALTRFIKLTPDSGPAFAVRGLCEFETGQYSESAQDIQQGLALGAGNQPRYEDLLRYHQLLLFTLNGEFETALREYAVFAKNGTPTPEILAGVGLAGLRMPMRPQDVDPSQQALVLAAGTAAFTFMAGDTQKGQQQFQDLFRRFPAAPNTHYLYGYLLFANDPDIAIEEFKHELEIVPNSAVAHVMMAWYFLLRNNAAEALPYAQKAATEASSSPSAQLVLGRSLIETGSVTEGINRLNAALKLDPDNLEIHLALVKGYQEQGRKDDAARERLLSKDLAKGQASVAAQP